MMEALATTLYRNPNRVFDAADRGETVTIRRKGREYLLTRKTASHALYGCLAGTVRKDAGKPVVTWKVAA
ncbi:MAG: hypothetical protein ACK45B_03710 [Limisphaerales bacterium]